MISSLILRCILNKTCFLENLRLSYFAFLFWLVLFAVSCSTLACSALKVKEESDAASLLRQSVYDLFESEDPNEHEVFRIFLSSDDYIRKQLNANDTITLAEDPSGNKAASSDLIPYNKINFKAKVVVKMTIYEDTGTIAKIRFLRSSGISEIDKLISEDVTRWKFEFPKGKIEPNMLEASFYIFLKSTINKEQAKKELKKYVE